MGCSFIGIIILSMGNGSSGTGNKMIGMAACIVAASGGYPKTYEKGYIISGLNTIEDATVFHSGTTKKEDEFLTAGGRVLGVTAMGETLRVAVDKAYKNIKNISFKDMHYRTDIGKHGV